MNIHLTIKLHHQQESNFLNICVKEVKKHPQARKQQQRNKLKTNVPYTRFLEIFTHTDDSKACLVRFIKSNFHRSDTIQN